MEKLLDALTKGEFNQVLTRYSDIVLAVGVTFIIAMMMVPLPTFLLDLLLVTNIAISVTMLMIAMYIQSAIKLAAYPTILLITTMFRLALNVSATRLILLTGDAGQVIH